MNKYDSIGEFLKDNTYNKKIKEIYIAIICLSISIILLGISQVAHTASHLTPSQEPEIALSEPLIDLCEHNDISCDWKVQIDKITDNSSEAIQDEIKRLANDVGLPQNTTLRLVNVAYCESKFKPSAIGYNENGTKDVGVFQINDIHNLSVEYRLDSKLNIKWAINEAKKNGLGAWQSSAHCWSK